MDKSIKSILIKKRTWRKLINYALIEWQIKAETSVVFGKPYWLTIDPTNYCQLKCPFCPTGLDRGIRSKSTMSLEDFKKIIDKLGPYLLHIDLMNWGEPLLNKDVYEMIKYAKGYDIDIKIDTNFNAFKPGDAEKLINSGLDCLSLSIDGLTRETYQRYRVGGDFNRVIENVKALVKKKKELGAKRPYIIWQFLVFKHNEHEVEKVREFAEGLGADSVGITPAFLPFKPGIKDEWLPQNPEYRHYEPEAFPDKPPWEWETKTQEEDIKVDVYKQPEKRDMCIWPWAGIAINPDGSVSACCSVEEEKYDFGNIIEWPFWMVWNNRHYRRARRHIAKYVKHKREVIVKSKHVCERCFSIGRANFLFQPWWRLDKYPSFSWWWDGDGPDVYSRDSDLSVGSNSL